MKEDKLIKYKRPGDISQNKNVIISLEYIYIIPLESVNLYSKIHLMLIIYQNYDINYPY